MARGRRQPEQDRVTHTRETFQRLAEESLVVMTNERDGSLTIHFQRGKLKKSEWRILNDEDPKKGAA